MKSQTTYSAEDFARYHNGTMSHADMRALEQAALTDPFLADALEGYAHTATAADDIAAINARILQKRGAQKMVSVGNKHIWWRVAASIVGLAGIGLLVYKLTSDPVVTTTLAENTIPETTKSRMDSTTAEVADMAVASENKAAEVQMNTARSEPKEQTVTAPGVSQERLFYTPARAAKSRDDVAKTIQGKVSNDVLADSISGNIATTSAELATAAATVAVNDAALQKRKEAEADIRGEIMKDAARTQAASRAKAANGSFSSNQIPKNQADSFNQYVQMNQRNVYNRSRNLAQGEVALVFDTDKKGKPQNVRVSRSTCVECESEAKRLLYEAPRRAANNRSDSVIISF